MNWKRIGLALLIPLCFFSLVFNFVEFGVNQTLLTANHSLEKYARDNNCGMFATSVYDYLDDNEVNGWDGNKLFNLGRTN